MGVLGELRTVGEWEHAAGIGLAAAVSLAWAAAQGVVASLRDAQRESRWASNLRDVIALGGVLLLGFSFALCGLPPAAAILFSATLGVVLELLRRGQGYWRWAAMVVAAGVSISIAVWPGAALTGADAVARWLVR